MAIMNEGERLRELLDGSMDPSELENYDEYYRLAERIYGREALDEMGITTPEEIEEEKTQNGSSEFTHDVILPSPKADQKVEETINLDKKPKRKLFLSIIGIIGLLLVGSNILVGVNAIVPDSIVTLCEDVEPPGEVEFTDDIVLNETTLTLTIAKTRNLAQVKLINAVIGNLAPSAKQHLKQRRHHQREHQEQRSE